MKKTHKFKLPDKPTLDEAYDIIYALIRSHGLNFNGTVKSLPLWERAYKFTEVCRFYDSAWD